MNFNQLQHAGSRTTQYILRFALQALPHPIGSRITGGLPAGSMRLTEAGLIIGGTPCTIPLFGAAMAKAALETGCDVLIARHGMHPEVLDPVLWDAVIWSGDHTIAVTDLVLYADPSGSYWLVPGASGPHIRMAPNGLHLEAEPPFMTWHQRCEGVCAAAKRIIAATRTTEAR